MQPWQQRKCTRTHSETTSRAKKELMLELERVGDIALAL